MTTQILCTQIQRPSGNYQPGKWGLEFLETLKNQYKDDSYSTRATALQENVRNELNSVYEDKGVSSSLGLIEDIQRLGLGYLFEKDIRRILGLLAQNNISHEGSLYETALSFRLFRHHGHEISRDVFKRFMSPQGSFNEHVNQDIKGTWSLYEASYQVREGEGILDEARVHARNLLADVKEGIEQTIFHQVTRALQLPLHYSATRLEARWYIDAYSKRTDVNSTLLELAKLDYNMLQGTYQEELAILSTWWKNLGLIENFPFARESLVQAYTWTIGVTDIPHHKYCRHWFTKIVMLVTLVDDAYDNYATLDEAQLLTDAVERWDVNLVQGLPDYMKLLFFAWYNTTNEIAYNALKEQGVNVLPYLRKKCAGQFKSYMIELTWFKTGYKPSLKEYMENGAVSGLGPMLQMFIYVLTCPKISAETLEYIDNFPDLIRLSSIMYRLEDDLGTTKEEMERGDVPKAIQCYMNDAGVTEEEARTYIRNLIEETWKKFNTEMWRDSSLPQGFVKIILDSNRMVHVFYLNGDGYGHPGCEMKDRISSMIFESVPM
ncbi:hypothetical protein ACHQM5_015836 [Ranunculus cassubicifolius]